MHRTRENKNYEYKKKKTKTNIYIQPTVNDDFAYNGSKQSDKKKISSTQWSDHKQTPKFVFERLYKSRYGLQIFFSYVKPNFFSLSNQIHIKKMVGCI